jgi:hypothetical protein
MREIISDRLELILSTTNPNVVDEIIAIEYIDHFIIKVGTQTYKIRFGEINLMQKVNYNDIKQVFEKYNVKILQNLEENN